MKRFLLFFFLLLTRWDLKGQTFSIPEILKKQHEMDWSLLADFPAAPDTFRILFLNPNRCPVFSPEEWINPSKKDIRAFTFSSGEQFLIYSSVCDPYSRTFICSTEGDSLHDEFNLYGAIDKIYQEGNWIHFTMISEPCCCMTGGSITTVDFSSRKELKQTSVHYESATTRPASSKQPGKIKFPVTDSLILRSSSKLNDAPHADICSGEMTLRGNRFRTILGDQIHEVFEYESKDNWHFLLVYLKPVKNGSNVSKTGYVGWVLEN